MWNWTLEDESQLLLVPTIGLSWESDPVLSSQLVAGILMLTVGLKDMVLGQRVSNLV